MPKVKSTKTLLDKAIEQYIESRDFNGLYLDQNSKDIAQAITLTKKGLIQVVSEEDFPNPHIRPWPSKRTIDEQVKSLSNLNKSEYGLCIYPTPIALEKHSFANKYPNKPYSLEMAQGRGRLELSYFKFEVLEQYRNDPRFNFKYDDFGVKISITSEADEDLDEPEEDKILIKNLGFSYDLSNYKKEDATSPIVRRVCVFFGDLAKLSATHQQRWKTYEIEPLETLKPHPIWWAYQMGHWADGIGPFFHFFEEIKAINQLHINAFGTELFRTTDRPAEFGWILRPSQQEWDSFVHQLDKLLSDNILSSGLDAMSAPKTNSKGEKIGSLKRLSAALVRTGIPEEGVREILQSFFDIRESRQAPAHRLIANIQDKTLIHAQVRLMEEVISTLEFIRRFWQKHRANTNWQEPDYLKEGAKFLRM